MNHHLLKLPALKAGERVWSAYVVEDEKDLALSRGSRCQRSDATKAIGRPAQRCPALREGDRAALLEQRAGGAGETECRTSKYHCERVERWCSGGGGGEVGDKVEAVRAVFIKALGLGIAQSSCLRSP